jgi:hypothetical protein
MVITPVVQKHGALCWCFISALAACLVCVLLVIHGKFAVFAREKDFLICPPVFVIVCVYLLPGLVGLMMHELPTSKASCQFLVCGQYRTTDFLGVCQGSK